MLRVWIVGAPTFSNIMVRSPTLLIIMLSYLVTLGTGTQSVTADGDTQHSDNLDKCKGVR